MAYGSDFLDEGINVFVLRIYDIRHDLKFGSSSGLKFCFDC